MKPVKTVPAEPDGHSENTSQKISDLLVPAEKIRYFAQFDLGKLDHLPSGRQELVALSIRIEAAFTIVMNFARAIMAEDHDDVPRKVREALAGTLALDFIERYGVLALLSGTILQILWAQALTERRAKAVRFCHGGEGWNDYKNHRYSIYFWQA